MSLLISGAFFFVAWSFCAEHLDAARYAFMPPQEPLVLGDVTECVPESMLHNSYVQLHGITEPRGLHRQVFAPWASQRGDLWYFRLLGSRGVFIEVPADAQRYGPATEVTVSGRVVDPQQTKSLQKLLQQYDTIWATQHRPQARLIEVGRRPGEGRLPYILMLVLLGLLGAANLWTLWRMCLALWRRPKAQSF